MLKIKALLAKIVSWAGFMLDWSDYGTNNTVDTWVPVFTGVGAAKLQHRVIPRNIMQTQTRTVSIAKTYGASTSITAPAVSNYTFVCWLQPATSGWVGSVYTQDPGSASTKIWNATASTSGNGNVIVTALYKANF